MLLTLLAAAVAASRQREVAVGATTAAQAAQERLRLLLEHLSLTLVAAVAALTLHRFQRQAVLVVVGPAAVETAHPVEASPVRPVKQTQAVAVVAQGHWVLARTASLTAATVVLAS